MDVLVPRVGEIIGGSQREERYEVVLRRLRETGLDEKPYWWYLDLRRFGTVPHSGFGLGLERMMMYLTGLKNIRDVIPFRVHRATPSFNPDRSGNRKNFSIPCSA
jgi:asparaginyl-tRNA synthetase